MKLKKIWYFLTKKEIKLPITIKQINYIEGPTTVLSAKFIKIKKEEQQKILYYLTQNISKNLNKETSRIYYNINHSILFILPDCFIFNELKADLYFSKSFILIDNTIEMLIMFRNKKRLERTFYTNFCYLIPYFLILTTFKK